MIALEVRATIAAVALAHATGKLVTTVYDHSSDNWRDIRAIFKGDTLDGYDTARIAKLSGTLPDLFDHVLGQYIHLTRDDEGYTGFSHFSGTHFRIRINGTTASLYDHDSEEWSQFSL